ncbi:hypothetical protein PGT21_017937 [Puccinia graminis f. sp. tritici]|uniref:Uncharacterized protein n=1 Tax=Puccinia graminis f. sp. tritici TaxID=56615 RepID=A0A5B0LTJ5_PUCGR|nr:hypothetical protein PGT21_017937 [Puccinia graminis f. sp. tritici]KAA1068327.1 hypothetical protein PGTUg99_034071 [Puccinia graminis f. sp. tritici]
MRTSPFNHLATARVARHNIAVQYKHAARFKRAAQSKRKRHKPLILILLSTHTRLQKKKTGKATTSRD